MPDNQGLLTRCLNVVERAGNRLPDPLIVFGIFAGIVIVVSAVMAGIGVSVTHPIDVQKWASENLLDCEAP